MADMSGTPIKAFLLEPTMTRRFFLRRFTFPTETPTCRANQKRSCDTGFVPLGIPDQPFEWKVDDGGYKTYPAHDVEIAEDDPRWPSTCQACGQPMPDFAERQLSQDQLWRRVDTGELIAKILFPPGALYYVEGPHYHFASVFEAGGPDGRVLAAVCPDGSHWCIESRASNCTMKNDDKHRCWVRHGDPRAGTVHVDKNGLTCGAGAGSILTGRWHGFLHNGQFVSC
jgi:hypothetical protein